MHDKSAEARYGLARTYYFLGRGATHDKPPARRPAGFRNAKDKQKDLQQAIEILEARVREYPAEPA